MPSAIIRFIAGDIPFASNTIGTVASRWAKKNVGDCGSCATLSSGHTQSHGD
jgi:hypothetical protein